MYFGMKYQKHSSTSHAAAVSAKPSAATLRLQIDAYLSSVGKSGATDEEMQNHTQITPNTQRPRRVELVESGRVFDSGFKRKTKSNRDATVWVHIDHATPSQINVSQTVATPKKFYRIIKVGPFNSKDEACDIESEWQNLLDDNVEVDIV